MSWIVADLKIALVLVGWIAAALGLGAVALAWLDKKWRIFGGFGANLSGATPNGANPNLAALAPHALAKTPAHAANHPAHANLPFFALSSLILGVALLCFAAQILNFFIPISPLVALLFLAIGVGLFAMNFRALFPNRASKIAALFALFAVLPLAFFSDSVGDSVNYHVQIVTWIQEQPIIFGLGNIHGRLAFNGLIYYFYALSDAGLVFPPLRSFVGNEVVYFGLFFAAFLVALNRDFSKPSALFVFFSLLTMPFILFHGEFAGLYCEGVGAVIGVLIFGLILLSFEHKTPQILIFCLFIAVFAAMVKIANAALVLSVALAAVVLLKKSLLSHKKLIFWLGILCVIFALPWALKGIATSGMLAYPASVGYFESLPWAVSEAQRSNEVCWIMSWARAPMKNCVEVLASSAWLGEWFSMKVRYFGYFKFFVFSFLASILLLAANLVLLRRGFLATNFAKAPFWCVFGGIWLGILFWFFSGPDPRFGMVYIIPLLALLFAQNFLFARAAKPRNLRLFLIFAFVLSVAPLLFITRRVVIFLWISLLFLPEKHRVRLAIFVLLISLVAMYHKKLGAIKELPKIRPIHIEERTTKHGLKIFVRKDSADGTTKEYLHEPRPSGPYFNDELREGEFWGRKIYAHKIFSEELK